MMIGEVAGLYTKIIRQPKFIVSLRACLISRFRWIFERFFVRLGSADDAYSTEYM